MLYWDAKRKFLRQFYNRDVNVKAKHVYTLNSNYTYYHDTGVWTYQDPIIGTDINYVFCYWARRMLYDTWRPYEDSEDREQIMNAQDCMLLMKRVISEYYTAGSRYWLPQCLGHVF